MGVHNNFGMTGEELKRKDCLKLKASNFITIGQLANLYQCTESNVKQNILKQNRKSKRPRYSKVDYTVLYPGDLTGLYETETEQKFIICNAKLKNLLDLRSFDVNDDLVKLAENNGFEFLK
jgi:hypothetical protein